MLDEIRNIKSGKKELREFGLTIGGILVILGFVSLWRGKPAYPYLLGAGTLFLASGLVFPAALLPFQKAWMAIAIIIGFFVSHIILILIFYLAITPIGLLLRILRNDILDIRILKDRASYWKDRRVEIKDRKSYENQF